MKKTAQKFKLKAKRYTLSAVSGFTLVEIVVAIAILATLIGGVFVAINPARQVNKAKDAATQKGLQEIKKALDLYYQDKNCYPAAQSDFTTALANGSEWKEGTTVYMKKVSLDGNNLPYIYVTDTVSSCPQWNVLYGKLNNASVVADICPLDESSCAPAGYDNTWACTTSGATNCGQVKTSALVTPTPQASPTASPSGAASPTPTTTAANFTIAMPASALPQLFTGIIDPKTPLSGQSVSLSVSTDGYENPSPITSVTAKVTTDTKTNTYSLALTAGTATNGTWSKTWTANDNANSTFIITITAVNSAGNTSSVDVSIR